jgi:hypothetical protein
MQKVSSIKKPPRKQQSSFSNINIAISRTVAIRVIKSADSNNFSCRVVPFEKYLTHGGLSHVGLGNGGEEVSLEAGEQVVVYLRWNSWTSI